MPSSLTRHRRSLSSHPNIPAGTTTGTTANGDPWKLYWPAGVSSGATLVHYFHPYGTAYNDLDGTPLLTAILGAGWAVASGGYSHQAPDDAWGAGVISGGNQRAVETTFMQVDAASRTAAPVTLGPIVCLGESMGLLNALDALRYESGITNVKGVYGICGVFNLADLYAGAHQAHINTTYNIPTGGTYAAQTAGRDPNLATAAQNVGVSGAKRFRYVFSCGDAVVHPDTNAKNFITNLTAVSGVTETSAWIAPDNGAHLTGLAINPSDFVAFGGRAVNGDATAPTTPGTPSVVSGTLAPTSVQIMWPYGTPPANLAGWNVYVNGTKKNGALIANNLLGSALGVDGKSNTDTTWLSTSYTFTQAMVGQNIFGQYVPQGATITALIAGGVSLSAATTATDTPGRLRFSIPPCSFSITGLTANTSYSITLRAVSIDGIESVDSTTLHVTTPVAPLVSLIQKSNMPTQSGVASTSFTANLPSIATANNMLAAYFVSRDANPPSTPSGWTLAGSTGFGFVGTVAMFYKTATGGETGITISQPDSAIAYVAVEEWAGLTTSNPLDNGTVAAVNNGTGTVSTITATEANAAVQNNELVLSIVGTGGGTGAQTDPPGGGFTREYEDPNGQYNIGIAVASKLVTTGGTQACTESWAFAPQRCGYVIAGFKV